MKPEDLFDDPHLTTPGAMVEVSKADGGTMPIPALPLEMAGRRFGRRLDVPRLGEHSAQIAAELGYEPQMIEELAAEGVLTLGDPAPSAAAPKLAEG
jgi:crotonobetainyl-CoA:carnitine CoA-transferase CaiB-like acyl-CoA transferase